MLHNVKEKTLQYGSGYSNWLHLMCDFSGNYYEIAISGKNAKEKLLEINQYYIPNKLIAGSTSESTIPLMEGRFSEDETYIYICVDGACKLPETDAIKGIEQLKIKF
ncbi:MAG: hypothetical protein IZT56_14800 [Bacteroidetes bacterium]|nr:hypothetical protein [Bacteroidota bacterium]